jgi:hypothetical protein
MEFSDLNMVRLAELVALTSKVRKHVPKIPKMEKE